MFTIFVIFRLRERNCRFVQIKNLKEDRAVTKCIKGDWKGFRINKSILNLHILTSLKK